MSQEVLHHFRGSHFEMGVQQGNSFRESLHALWKQFRHMDIIRALKPRGIPTKLFFAIAKKKAHDWLRSVFEQHCPRQVDRIRGIAQGAGIDLKVLFLLLSTEVVFGENDYEIPVKCGCTSIALAPEKITSGETLCMRNFDYQRVVVPYLRVRSNAPSGRLRSLDLTASPLPGTFNGMNEAGVALMTDEVFPIKFEKKDGLPASLLIQEALETCRSTQEVVAYFRQAPRGSCNKILVADATGDFRAMEYTPTVLKEVTSKASFLVATNHYEDPELVPSDMPRAAVFGKKAPPELQGHNIQETSFFRLAIATRFLQETGKVSAGWLKKLAACHHVDANHADGWDTICHHDPINNTSASMIFNLTRRTMEACFGNPCENQYRAFDPQWNTGGRKS